MHSQSCQNTQLKVHRYVSDSPGQVVEGLDSSLFSGVQK